MLSKLSVISRGFATSVAQPLSGIKILDLTRIIAGPYCSMLLGDLGAEVFKVERLNVGDECRHWGPPYLNNTTTSVYFTCVNRNKKSICIDFTSVKGRQIIQELAKQCDVLIENFVPGKLAKYQLDYESLKVIAPQLIYCSITGYGSSGLYSKRPGYDQIAAAVGGFLHITGPEDGEPVKCGVAITDLCTGLYAHGAIMAALLQRNTTKTGQKIDCNLLSTQLSTLINIGANYLNAGIEAKRLGTSHASLVPYEAFPTKDGYLTICCGSDAQFLDFCKRLSQPQLAKDSRFLNNDLRVQNRGEMRSILRDIFKGKTKAELIALFDGASFPYGPVNTLAETFNDPHVKDIGIIKTMEHPRWKEIKMVGHPVAYNGCDIARYSLPPELGEHTEEVLTTLLKYTKDEINELIKNKIEVPVLRLRLKKPKTYKQVQWSNETVDNEFLNKKKSKCCCIFEKKKLPTDDSSDEDSDRDECDHCHGHVEQRSKNKPASTTNVESKTSTTVLEPDEYPSDVPGPNITN